MNFRPMIRRNLRHNFQKYAAYFFANSFCMMTFFLFLSLLVNERSNNAENFTSVSFVIFIAVSVFINFSVVFIVYAYSTFLKARNKEFGLYLTQGMTNKELIRMVTAENFAITSVSIFIGLLAGTLFSKIFILTAARISGYDGVNFRLRPINFTVSILFFFFVYLILFSYTVFTLRRIRVLELMESSRKPYVPNRKSLILGISGVIILFISAIAIFMLKSSSSMMIHENYAEIALNAGMVGLYLLLYGFGSLYVFISSFVKKKHMKNMLILSQINHRFSKNKNIIFLLTVLGFAMVYYGGYGYTLNDKRNAFSSRIPVDIMYIDKSENGSGIERLRDIIKESGGKIKGEKSSAFLKMKLTRIDETSSTSIENVPAGVISQSEFSRLTGQYFTVNGDQCIVITNISNAKKEKWKSGGKALLKNNNEEFVFSAKSKPYVLMLPEHAMIPGYIVVLQDEDYAKLAGGADQTDEEIFYSIDLNNMGNINEIMETIKAKSAVLKDNVILRNYVYEITSTETKFSRFLFTFVSMLLLLISGCILYFNLRLEMDSVKGVYERLFRMGITDREMENIVLGELRMVFCVPLILSSVLGGLYVIIEVINDSQRYLYYRNTLFTILCAAVFYSIFYVYAKGRFIKEITNNMS